MSWVVTRLSDNAVIGEFFEKNTVDRINREKYRVETADVYLGRLNAEIRAGQEAAADLGPSP